MNKCFLLGRIVKDPEIKDLGGTNRMAKYTLAVTRTFKSAENNVDFIPCTCFGKPAENAEKYLKKGMLIAVDGWIRTGKYKGKDGNTVYTTEVQVERAEFAESKKEAARRMKEEEEAESAAEVEQETVVEEPEREDPKPKASNDEWMNVPDSIEEDEVPFS